MDEPGADRRFGIVMQERVQQVIADIGPGRVGHGGRDALRLDGGCHGAHRDRCKVGGGAAGHDRLVLRLISKVVRYARVAQVDADIFRRHGAARSRLPDAQDRIRAALRRAGERSCSRKAEDGRDLQLPELPAADLLRRAFTASHAGLIVSPPNGSKPVIRSVFMCIPPADTRRGRRCPRRCP